MPFDGYDFSLVHLFDEILWFFGPNGERWVQGTQIDGIGNRCLVGALAGCRAKLKLPKKDRAAHYLRAAIRRHQRGNRMSIVQFNDDPQRVFEDVRDVLFAARGMALTSGLSARDDRQLDLPI
jgi:hypothetical protein